MTKPDVVVIGAGVGGLSCAVLLGAAGLRVRVIERAPEVGGKAAAVVLDGVEVDTGPSVLTLPHVFEDIFEAAGLSFSSEVSLTTPSPAFRYVYPDGVELDVFHDVEQTLASVRQALGSTAGDDLAEYLEKSARIWEAAAPHFVYSQAPELPGLLFGGFSRWNAVARIDPFRTMARAIDETVRSEHLRKLLRRYATYNGSDPRSAPATLGCIAHVELALGGFGVRGGMVELVRALERAARRVGVDFVLDTEVEKIEVENGGVQAVRLTGGTKLPCQRVVANADVAHLTEALLESPRGLKPPATLSMSAHTAIIAAQRQTQSRPAHTVLFPADYEQEFRDIFDHDIVPTDPTVYLCAQEACHLRAGWPDDEPVFCMVNAPAVREGSPREPGDDVRVRVLDKLTRSGLIGASDRVVWWRTPEDLAARFPGSRGSLYGAASNSMTAAFQRPANRVSRIPGLYLASGTAHPGGGVPMVALSGKQAALALLQDTRVAA